MTTLLYFTADWCAPCKRFFPLVEDEATSRDMVLHRFDVDLSPRIAELHDVRSVPTVIALADVEDISSVQDRFGVLTRTELRKRLDRLR